MPRAATCLLFDDTVGVTELWHLVTDWLTVRNYTRQYGVANGFDSQRAKQLSLQPNKSHHEQAQ